MNKRLFAVLAIVVGMSGQLRSQTGGNIANLAGTLYASNFANWTVAQGNNGPYSWSSASVCTSMTSGGVTFKPFVVGSPIKIVDNATPSNSEVVTVTSIQVNGSSCSIVTTTPAHQHFSFYLSSATAGLQEAINFSLQTIGMSNAGSVILVTPDWTRLGGTTSTITTAQGNGNVTVLDERSSIFVPYTWNGSIYVAQPFSGALLPSNAPVFGITPTTSRPLVLSDLVTNSGTIWSGSPCTVGTNALLANGQCGASGGNPNGIGTIQTANLAGTAFASLGQINTDVSNTSNNGATQTQANLCGAACSMTTPPTSADTELGNALPVQAGKVSSLWIDNRGNQIGTYSMNPQVVNTQGTVLNGYTQVLENSILGFTEAAPNAGGNFGQPFGRTNYGNYYNAPGWSNGESACPLFCAPPGFVSDGDWHVDNTYLDRHFFNSAGIHQSRSEFCFFYGIGDGQCRGGASFNILAGGFLVPSDEGHHTWGEDHTSTVADFHGTLTTITDVNHIFVTPTDNVGTQGQGRLLIDQTRPIVANAEVNLINQTFSVPGHDYGTLVVNGVTLPVSTAQGTMTNACTVPLQDRGVVIGQNSGVNGCAVTLTSGAFAVGNGPVCAASNFGNLINLGMVLSSASTLSGGQQTITVTMHRSVAAGADVFQGGMCSTAVDFTADHHLNPVNSNISASVFPIIGSTDAHTVVYASYAASANWQPIPNNTSWAGTTDTGNTYMHQGFTLANLKRTGGIVTGNLTSGGQSNPPLYLILNNQKFFSITGCSDASLNFHGVNALISMPAADPTFITYPQAGIDTAGCTAVVYTNSDLVNFFPAAEAYDVDDHTPGISVDKVVDGTFAISAQPLFQVGDTLAMPTNYSEKSDGLAIDQSVSQPQYGNQAINILMGGYGSGFQGSAINVQNISPATPGARLALIGNGGNQRPTSVLTALGPFSFGLAMDTAPLPGGAVLSIGGPFGWNNLTGPVFHRYNILQTDVGGGNNFSGALEWDHDAASFNWYIGGFSGKLATFNQTLSTFTAPFAMANAQFETNSGTNPKNPIPFSQINLCDAISPGSVNYPLCYSRVAVPAPAVTNSGTPGTTQYFYILLINDPAGPSWSLLGATFTGNATLNGTNFNTISCSSLPAGLTGEIYAITNPVFKTVGACPNSSATVNDTGTYGPNLGNAPLNAGLYFQSGGFLATGTTGGYCWTQPDIFGTTTSPFTRTTCLSQPSAGVVSVDTTTVGNGLGTIQAAKGIFGGTLGQIQIIPNLFSTIGTCNSGLEGSVSPVTDSTTNTWGATVTGGGALHILAYCDGTTWTVVGK